MVQPCANPDKDTYICAIGIHCFVVDVTFCTTFYVWSWPYVSVAIHDHTLQYVFVDVFTEDMGIAWKCYIVVVLTTVSH